MIDSKLPHTSPRRGRRRTVLAATATAAFLAMSAAAPALADGAQGTYTGKAMGGMKVSTTKGDVGTSLFNLTLDDGTVLQTYCIDFETNIVGGSKYSEDAWKNYPGKGQFASPAKVHWILQNSFPQVDTATLAEKSGVAGLNKKQALTATQAAIWHFSNDVDLKGQNDKNVVALYDYLVKNAKDMPQTAEPDASLSITPGSAEGKAGETIGEFTVETSAKSLPLKLDAPEGVELVDLETGEKVETVGNGDQFGVKVPKGTEPGEATVSGSVSTSVHMGRLFKGIKDQKPTQTLITAESSKATVKSGATVTWTKGGAPQPSESPSKPDDKPNPQPSDTASPSPSETPSKPAPEKPGDDNDEAGGLPVTGAALGGLVAAAAAALGIGGAAMYLARKRRGAGDSAIN